MEPLYALLIAIVVLTGLYLANIAYDSGMQQYLSRKIGHLSGGCGYLLAALLFKSPWWPIAVSGTFAVVLGSARLVRPSTFRGVGGSARQYAFAEVYFPAMGTLSLVVGWAWLKDPWLATAPILFMAWGDCLTGLIRSHFYGREVKGNLGSIGMLLFSLVIATLFAPYWIAACGAVAATVAERFTPLSRGLWDDNWSVTLLALTAMAPLHYFLGG